MSLLVLSRLVGARAGVLAALTSAVFGSASAAGAAEPVALGEEDFLAKFEKADPRFEVLDARVDGARADVTAARILPNPSVSYTREETFSSGEALPENYVLLAWPLDISGRRSRRIDAAEAGVQATRAEAAFERFVLTVEALAMYHDAVYARSRVQTLRDGREALARLVDIVQKRVSAGDASGYDLKRLELELAAYDDLISTAETELQVARRRLGVLVGEPDTLYDAADPLVLPPLPGPLDALMSVVLAGRQDYQGTRRRAEQAEHELLAAKRGWVPALELTGGLKTSDLETETATGYVAGIALSIPLFDHGQADRQRAAAAKRRANAESRVLEQRVPALVRAAHEELERRIGQAQRFADGQLDKIDDLVRGAEVSYREGERPGIFELLDAYRTARDARLRFLELQRDSKTAEIDLWRALGRRP